eukprot:5384429-Pleurochrysis_carterae.AAC.1
MCSELGVVAAEACLAELRDPKYLGRGASAAQPRLFSRGLFHTLFLEIRGAVATMAVRDFDREAQVDCAKLAA